MKKAVAAYLAVGAVVYHWTMYYMEAKESASWLDRIKEKSEHDPTELPFEAATAHVVADAVGVLLWPLRFVTAKRKSA